MSYIWKEGEPRANNTVDVDGFNSEYNAYKSNLNGGLDRDNIPQAAVGDAHYVYNSSSSKTDTPFYRAIVKHMVFPGEYKGYTTTATGSHCFGGLRYRDYNAGFVEVGTQTLQCKEGMLQVELRGYLYINPVNAAFFPKSAKLRITVDNVPIIESAGGYLTFINSVYLTASTPVAEGTVTVGLYFSYSPSGSNATADDADSAIQFYMDGLSMALLNRYR